MNTTNKTVLITGGGSGIGFEIAKLFSQQGNKVIISGKDEEKLKKASAQLDNMDYFVADLSKRSDITSLAAHIAKNYPGLDILVNNAAVTHVYQLGAEPDPYDKASLEMTINYLAVIGLTAKLLPVLSTKGEAAIVNVNAIIGLAPSIHMPTHSASKAALRSYTQLLRYTLEKSSSTVKVFEVIPPLVNTDFSKALHGGKGMPAAEVAQALLQGLESNTTEIRIGLADQFYKSFFAGSDGAVAFLNQPRG